MALLAAFCWSAAAAAADADLLDDRFYLSLGTFIVGTDTKVRVNGKTEIGDKIDLEQTFGASDSSRFRVDGYWRFADRHKLRFLWFNWRYDATRELDEDIEFEGETYPVSARVRFKSDFSVYELAYEYAFLRRENYELSGTIGVHYTELSVALKTRLDVGGGEVGSETLQNDASVNAPLPAVGLRALWRIGGDFWLDASGQYFALSIDDYDGNLQDYRVAVVWQPRTYAGVGLGYNAFSVDVDLNRPDFHGSLDWAYYGPQVFFSVSF